MGKHSCILALDLGLELGLCLESGNGFHWYWFMVRVKVLFGHRVKIWVRIKVGSVCRFGVAVWLVFPLIRVIVKFKLHFMCVVGVDI